MDKKLTIKDLPEWNETRTNPLEEFIYQWDCVSDKGSEFLPTLIDMINYVRSDDFKPRENPPALLSDKDIEDLSQLHDTYTRININHPTIPHDSFMICANSKIASNLISEQGIYDLCKLAPLKDLDELTL